MSFRSKGYRSLPVRRRFVAAMGWFFLHGLGVLAAAILFHLAVTTRQPRAIDGLLAAVAIMAVTWFIALLFRRAAKCPLCRGTPLHDNGNVKHPKARKFGPLNPGVSAMLSLLVTQRFRCMDCGTPFDLMKSSKSAPKATRIRKRKSSRKRR
jgi:hypothetical protein